MMGFPKLLGLAGVLPVALDLVSAPTELADMRDFVVVDRTNLHQLDEVPRSAFVSELTHVPKIECQSNAIH